MIKSHILISDCCHSEQRKAPGSPMCHIFFENGGCPSDISGHPTCGNYQPAESAVYRPRKPPEQPRHISGLPKVQYGMRLAHHDDIFKQEVEDLWVYDFAGISGLWLQELNLDQLERVRNLAYTIQPFPQRFREMIDLQILMRGER